MKTEQKITTANLKKRLAKSSMARENHHAVQTSNDETKRTEEKNEKDDAEEAKLHELEQRIQDISIQDTNINIKVEATDEVHDLTNNLTKLEVNDGEDDIDDDLIARGPQRNLRDYTIPSPYTRTSRQFLSGGKVIETSNLLQCTVDQLGLYNIQQRPEHPPPYPILFSAPLQQAVVSSSSTSAFTDNLSISNVHTTAIGSGSLETVADSMSQDLDDLDQLVNELSNHTDLSNQSNETTDFNSLNPSEDLFSTEDIVPSEKTVFSNEDIECLKRFVTDKLIQLSTTATSTMEVNNILDGASSTIANLDGNSLQTTSYTDNVQKISIYHNNIPSNGMNIPAAVTNVMNIPNICEYSPSGESSGYGSTTTTPANSPGPSNSTSGSPPSIYEYSPPNVLDNIPLSVLEIQQQQQQQITTVTSSSNRRPSEKTITKCRPILPRPDSTYTSQQRFLKYLHSKEKEHIIKRFLIVVNQMILNDFSQQDQDGDTALMKLAANRDALDLHGAPAHMCGNPQAIRFAFAYGIIERLEREFPVALKFENAYHQNALYLAAKFVPECPLFAAYIAESMHRHHFDVNKPCRVQDCAAQGGTLLHCVAAMGNEYVGVLKELLKLPGIFMVDAKNEFNDLTPLQVAVKTACNSQPRRVHKIVETLIKHGASVSVKFQSNFNATPLMVALQPEGESAPDLDLLEVLLKTGDRCNEVNTPDTRNIRPINAATMLLKSNNAASVPEIMKKLIKYGATTKKEDLLKIVDVNNHPDIQQILTDLNIIQAVQTVQ